MSPDELQKLLTYWQRVLRLQDWTIRVRFRREYEIPGYAGCCKSAAKLMEADVAILDPIDHPPNADAPFDIEQTLVHELVHVRFGHLDREWGGADLVLYEQAVEQLAWSLVRLNRGIR